MEVPFNRAYVPETSLTWIERVLSSGHHSGDGPASAKVSKWIEDLAGSGRALLTPSGTDAIEMALMAAGVGRGDEVIVPSFTFTSVATPVLRQGAKVQFADVSPAALGLTPELVEEAATERTKAVLAVHYAGIGDAPDALADLCARRGWTLIEDCAHSLDATWKGRALGTFGRFATFSFHVTKNLSCGEGGALLVNQESDYLQAEIIREKGTNRSQYLRGEVNKYRWVGPGSSFLLAEPLAGMLMAGIDDFARTQATRRRAWDSYQRGLRDWADRLGILLPSVPAEAHHPAHIYFLRMPSTEARTALIDHCRARGVNLATHYEPLADSPYGHLLDPSQAERCPYSSEVASTLVRLPMFSEISAEEVDYVLDTVTAWASL